jgi:hypothetical protein
LARGYLHKFNTRITKRRGEVERGQVDNYVHIGSKSGGAAVAYVASGEDDSCYSRKIHSLVSENKKYLTTV